MVGFDFTVLMPLKDKDEVAQHRKGKRKIRAAAAELVAIGKLCADSAKRRLRKHGALLYDKRGLPK